MNNLQFINYMLKKTWNSSFVYLTFWGLLIQVLYYIGVLKKFQESILLLLITISVIGLIITYIYPREIALMAFDYEVKNDTLQIIDLVTHQIPLIIFLVMYDKKIKPDNLIFAVSVFLIYCLIYNPFRVYGIICECKAKLDCKCRNKFYLAIGLIIIYFMIMVLAINNNIFT